MSTKILTDPQLPKDHQQTGSLPRRKETSILPRNSLEIPLLTFESTNTTRGIEKGLRYRAGRLRLCHVREESCPVFFFFPTPRGDREEERVEGGWKMPGSHSTTAFNPFLTPRHRQRGGGERKQRAYTQTRTHGVRNIYSKASRALARCTKRKLSCRPEINYRVSRGWIRKGDGSCVVTTR